MCSLIFALVVSVAVIVYITFKYVRTTNVRNPINISLVLTCNTCVAIICSSCSLTLMLLSTIGGDLRLSPLQQISSWACYLRGYLHFVFVNSIYLSYVLQAGFRLCRIAFRECKYLRTIYSFSYFILGQWTLSFLLISPILIAGNDHSSLITFLPDEHFCQVPMTSIRGIVFSILTVYFVPLCCIGIIYLWIVIYIRRQNCMFTRLVSSVQRQHQRDTIIIKRICVVMIALLSLGIPSCLFVIAFMITNHLHWASYRVGWMTIAVSFALISLSSLYVTPQIYQPIRSMCRSKGNNARNGMTSSSNNQKMERQKDQRESIPLKATVTASTLATT